MIEKLNQILQGLIERVKDSGWVDFTPSGYNVIWEVKNVCRGRRVGNLVNLQFMDIRTTAIISTEIYLVNGLPEEFRPDTELSFPLEATPGSGIKYGGLLTIRPNGLVVIAPQGGDRYVPTYGIRANAVCFGGGGATLKRLICNLLAPVRRCLA